MRRLLTLLLTAALPGTGRRRAARPRHRAPRPHRLAPPPGPPPRPRSPYAREAAANFRVDVTHVPLTRPYLPAPPPEPPRSVQSHEPCGSAKLSPVLSPL
ncbi:hypothetical protein ACFY93_21705 [Streptomyces sp. NPDC008313]|uniref:hypothetical protein n=1 Tax=Streptomyces sp. NPDC008313 TaxID=3364826 RepID=UPI0036F12C5A